MDRSLSVNAAVDQLPVNGGRCIVVHGILHFRFEDVSLRHYPVSECRDNEYDSAIWLSEGTGSIRFNRPVLARWRGKRVVVTGTVYGPSRGFRGCGHMSLFAAEMLVTSIDRMSPDI